MSFLGDIVGKVFSSKRDIPAVDSLDKSSMHDASVSAGYPSAYGFGHGRGYGSVLSGGDKSPAGLSHSGMGRIYDGSTLRRNVRDAMYDSVHCKTIVQRFADTQAGSGLRLRMQPNFRVLGITREEAESWAADTSDRFHLWAKSHSSSIDGVNNFYENQHLFAVYQHRDNDTFIRLHYSDEPELISPVQIQFIDPEQICGWDFTSTDGFQFNSDGIQRDKNGKEIAYKIFVKKTEMQYETTVIPAVGQSGRRHMLHCFVPEFAGQGRGIPTMAHSLQEFEGLTDFELSHIQKAIDQSIFSYYTKPSDDAPASNPLIDKTHEFSGPYPSSVLGANPDPTLASQATGLPAASFNPLPEFTKRTIGSTWVANLRPGEDIKAVPNTAPAEAFDSFVDTFVMHLSASVSMPVEALLMKFGQNYSASRATLVLLWRVINKWREIMAADFLNPVVEAWLSEEIAAGRITAPGWLDPRLRSAWMCCRWVGDPIPSIDPNKEADAAAKRAGLGHETLDDGALNYNGSSGESNRARLAEEVPELVVLPSSPGFKYIRDGKPIGEPRDIAVTDDGSEIDPDGDSDFESDEDKEDESDE